MTSPDPTHNDEQAPDNQELSLTPSKYTSEDRQARTGSQTFSVQADIVRNLLVAIGVNEDDEEHLQVTELAYDTLLEMAPRDTAEGMLVSQMIAAHHSAMRCMRCGMAPGQAAEVRDMNLKHAQRLMGLYERQLAALDKRRGRGKQKITVEHVNVHAGGQAIVGDVNAGQNTAQPSQATVEPPRGLADQSSTSRDGEQLKDALAVKDAAPQRKKAA
tara:strand:+ start:1305 stop:1952 length:648 start_codon:yes stop_codon:yes gene_type:complete